MFKERLKELREAKGLTQSQLSKELNIGRASVSNYELGSRIPDIDILVRMSEYFDVTTDYLSGRSNFKQVMQEMYFSKDEKVFLSNINSSLDSKSIEEHIIKEINYFKKFLLSLFGAYEHNLTIELSFVKSVHLLYSIYLDFNNKTNSFFENINSSPLKIDENVNSKDISSEKHILEIIHTRLNELDSPKYNLTFNLSRIVEELFNLKSDLESLSNETSISTLLENIEASSNKNNLSILNSIIKNYLDSKEE
ncbi:helix-turn-helix domain-containing protein [Clostridium thailandense]|uniref:helix-turn-helix domain-containing protein n=1 Tax=Clostridium thailandense TaxID=2794346 RepID=UPI0039893B94